MAILNHFLSSLCLLSLQFSSWASAIRNDIGLQENRCRNTVQGRYLLSDDNGYVCDALSVDPESRCCPSKGEQFSCHGCNLISKCCNSYEFCVSCCLNPSQNHRDIALQVKVAKPVTAGTYASLFDFCAGRCRHSSESVVHENAYFSDFHHCFSLPSNASGSTDTLLEARLAGISILVGRQGESCEYACKLRGQSCVPGKLSVLNHCESLQKYMSCRGGCLASVGPDQPAEVVEDAPKHLYPGACLYAKTWTRFSCDGFHQHTRRLCPCA
ncbi:hypothetical protein Nepgr_030410 [Nepenthes gracilis]|uniref:SREBP regulating gene protein n=1 Tax=Nepenthes gracilis TaxID=150966 RepID=A0AAD3TFR1_NEPGR|nr:hypothetical protein Nepgr_030410 [Nepenthes gracilis]